MIYRELQATFGALNEQTLELKDGLNVIYGPNESGKSTWAAFLRAMLYGISTREQSKIGFLADKEKYKPWSGAPMYGKLRLMAGGRPICIERKAGRTGILQKASVVYEDTGLAADLPEPPGEALIGVKKEVFDRSALTAQGNLAVNGDKEGELARRITSLVQTGDDEATFSTTKARLEKWRRARRYNKSGLIPELEAQLMQDLRMQSLLREEAEALTAQFAKKQALEEEFGKLQSLQAAWDASRAAKKLEEIRRAEEGLKNAKALCAPIPDEEKLDELARLERAYLEAARTQGMETPKKDVSRETSKFGLISAGVGLAVGLLLGLLAGIPIGVLGALVAFAVCFGMGISQKRRKETKESEAIFAENQEKIRVKRAALETALHEFDATATVDTVGRVIERERKRILELRKAHQDAALAEERLALLLREVDLEDLEARAKSAEQAAQMLDLESAMARLAQVEREIRALDLDCVARQARMSAKGELAALEERISDARGQMEAAQTEFDALTLALDTLQEVNGELERRFAPVLEKKAAKLLAEITDGRFQGVDLQGTELELSVREHTAAPPRSVLSLSGGTLDELYLSLRLAICETIFDETEAVPILLDDVFVNYDDARLARMLAYLKELAKKRQIILFSCHKRETQMLQGDAEVNCISLG